jgi:hypothetical protein
VAPTRTCVRSCCTRDGHANCEKRVAFETHSSREDPRREERPTYGNTRAEMNASGRMMARGDAQEYVNATGEPSLGGQRSPFAAATKASGAIARGAGPQEWRTAGAASGARAVANTWCLSQKRRGKNTEDGGETRYRGQGNGTGCGDTPRDRALRARSEDAAILSSAVHQRWQRRPAPAGPPPHPTDAGPRSVLCPN